MRKLLTGAGALLLLAVAAAGALYLWAGSEFTICYGRFDSRAAADRAARAGDDAGFSTDVRRREAQWSVEFETGETGADATERVQAFADILRRERGRSGHGPDGCLERTPLQ